MNTPLIETITFNHQAWADARPKHISRRKFAREIGTTDSNLILIEKGESKPSIMLALAYCVATRLPMGDLLGVKK
jgi:DNA-binding XRE family transcriptional regulator